MELDKAVVLLKEAVSPTNTLDSNHLTLKLMEIHRGDNPKEYHI